MIISGNPWHLLKINKYALALNEDWNSVEEYATIRVHSRNSMTGLKRSFHMGKYEKLVQKGYR